VTPTKRSFDASFSNRWATAHFFRNPRANTLGASLLREPHRPTARPPDRREACPQGHEAHRWRAVKMACGKTATQEHENRILPRMPYRPVFDRCQKLDVAIANVVGPQA